VSGVFTVKEIPDSIDDPVEVTVDVMDEILISESRSNSFKNVKNTTEIFGAILDAGYTASTCTTSTDTYALVFSTPLEVLEANSTYSFTTDSTSVAGQKIKIDSLTAYPIYVRNIGGTESALPAGTMVSGVQYVVKYIDEKFYLQGESGIHVIVQEVSAMPSAEAIVAYKAANNCRNVTYVVNPNSPFAADIIGEIKQVKKGGEFEDIYTTALATERGLFENYKTTRLQDSIELKCKIIPTLDANQKIQYHASSSQIVPNSLYIDEFGNLVSLQKGISNPFSMNITDGQLIMTTTDDFETSPFTDAVFSIDETGEFIATGLEDVVTCLTQEITYDFDSYTMSIRAIQFYPISPFNT
jgi:hypothetical protein